MLKRGGLDSHNAYGRIAVFPGNNFAYHLIPFTGAFAAHVAAVMPTYSILEGVSLDGKPLEQVGAGFNRQLLTGLLRGTYHFDGVILTDFAITNDCVDACLNGIAPGQRPNFNGIGMPWGVESLTRERRFAKAIQAGVDQIGGTEESNFLVDSVHDALLTRARLEQSAYRILLQKFQLGLFEDPYVDPAGTDVVGNPRFRQAGLNAQKRAQVLLQNKQAMLPLHSPRKLFLFGIDPASATRHGFTVVDTPQQADLAVIRAKTPSEPLHPNYIFGSVQHEGRLDFHSGDPAYDALVTASAHVPTIFCIYLDRPAILTNIVDKSSAILANFGIDDDSLFDVLTGATAPTGHLPFELPSSMQAVESQREDVPHDSAHPLFPYGFGLNNFATSLK